MSGTSHGTTVLHIAPESFIGGPLALVSDGDIIELDIPGRRLDLMVSPDELAARREAWTEPVPRYKRGWGALYDQNILQANEGCDFEVLRGRGGLPSRLSIMALRGSPWVATCPDKAVGGMMRACEIPSCTASCWGSSRRGM